MREVDASKVAEEAPDPSWYYSSALLPPTAAVAAGVEVDLDDACNSEGSSTIDNTNDDADDNVNDRNEEGERPLTEAQPAVDYPKICKTVASKSAVQRWKRRWMVIAKEQRERLEHQQQVQETVLRKGAAPTANDQPNCNGVGNAWHGALRVGLVAQSYPYSTSSTSVGDGGATGPRNGAATASGIVGSSADPCPDPLLLRLVADCPSAGALWVALLSNDLPLLQTILQATAARRGRNSGAGASQSGFCHWETHAPFSSALLHMALDSVAQVGLDVAANSTEPSDGARCIASAAALAAASNTWPADGWTAAHVAAHRGLAGALELLLRFHVCDVDARDRGNKASPLLYACEAGHMECARILARHGADMESRDKLHETALHKAVRSRQQSLVQWLCDYRCGTGVAGVGGQSKALRIAVNAKNKHRETPLMLARSREIAVVLISAGADPTCRSVEGLDAAAMAARRGDSRVLSALLSCNTNAGTTPLPRGSAQEVLDHVALGRATALHEACGVGSLACVRLLLGRSDHAAVNSGDGTSQALTPLMKACLGGHVTVVEELLLHAAGGVDRNVEDTGGATALVRAAAAAAAAVTAASSAMTSGGLGSLACMRALLRAPRPLPSVRYVSTRGESVLCAVARLVREDYVTAAPAPAAGLLPVVAELVAAGAPVTERFVWRFVGPRVSFLLRKLKFGILQLASQGDKAGNAEATTGDDQLPPKFGGAVALNDGTQLSSDARRGRTRILLHLPHVPAPSVDAAAPYVASSSPWRSLCPPDLDHADVEFLVAENGDGDAARGCVRLRAHAFIVARDSSVLRALLAQLRAQQRASSSGSEGATRADFSQRGAGPFSLMLRWMYTRDDVTASLDPAAVYELLLLSNELLVAPLQVLCERRIAATRQLFDRQSLLELCDVLCLDSLRVQLHAGPGEGHGEAAGAGAGAVGVLDSTWPRLERLLIAAHVGVRRSPLPAAEVVAAAWRAFTGGAGGGVSDEAVWRAVADTGALPVRIALDAYGHSTDADDMDVAAKAVQAILARDVLLRGSRGPSEGWRRWLTRRYQLAVPSQRDIFADGCAGVDEGDEDSSLPPALQQLRLRLRWMLGHAAEPDGFDVVLHVRAARVDGGSETHDTHDSHDDDGAIASIPAHRAVLAAASGKLAAMLRFVDAQRRDAHHPSSPAASTTHQQHVLALTGADEDDVRDMLWHAYTGALPPWPAESRPDAGASDEEPEVVEAEARLRLLWRADEYLAPRWQEALVRRLLRRLCPRTAVSCFAAAQALRGAGHDGADADSPAEIGDSEGALAVLAVAAAICGVASARRSVSDADVLEEMLRSLTT